MTVRQHLQKAHDRMAANHTEMATRHERLSKYFASMGKAALADGGTTFDAIADEHATIAKTHASMAKFHKESADACAKAVEADLAKLQPDSISSVTPSDVPPFGIRAIPRPGQPEKAVDKAAVPAAFRYLVSNGDE